MIPLLAMLSVALCTAMVIIVLSVMHGFLDYVTAAGRKMIGDVAIEGPITGFPYYEEVLERVRSLDVVEAASPVISYYAFLRLPYEPPYLKPVQIFGIEPESFDAVTGFGEAIYWRRLDSIEEYSAAERRSMPHWHFREYAPEWDLRNPAGHSRLDWENQFRRQLFDSAAEEEPFIGPMGMRTATSEWSGPATSPSLPLIDRLQRAGETLHTPAGTPGVALGIRIALTNERRAKGFYEATKNWFMTSREATITVPPLTTEGALLDAESRIFPIVNEVSVERHDVDSNYVYVPFAVLQDMLKMGSREEVDETKRDEFGDPVRTGRMLSARASQIVVKARPGVPAQDVQTEAQAAYEAVWNEHPDGMLPPEQIHVRTWEEQTALFTAAVKKETALVTTLFGIISLVAVILVLSIFWTVVQQKTRDVGILRSVGASRLGIAWLFLRYGAILGVVGALLGAILAHLVVWNINPLHEFIGEKFHLVIWDPEVYYFNEIPNHVNPLFAAIVMACGVGFAIVGALIPSIRAAFINPVTALRYE